MVQHRLLIMENELDLSDLDKVQEKVENNLQIKNRFATLSEKITLTTKEKEEAIAKIKIEADGRLQAEKERDFFKDFSTVSAKYPQAAEHQDKILERVNRGYSTQDATLAVLNEVGQLQPITAGTVRIDNPAGGSAATALSDSGNKSESEMTQAERRQALLDMEKEGVNLFKI